MAMKHGIPRVTLNGEVVPCGTFTWSTRLACGQAIRTDAVAAIGEGYCNLASEGAGKHLPSQQRLSYKTQDDVGPFAVQVVRPLAASFVLLPLHDGKAVEQNEDGKDDSVHKARCR